MLPADDIFLFLLCVQNFFAGRTEPVMLPVQASNDPATTGNGTLAVLVKICLARTALLGSQGLGNSRCRMPCYQRENDEAKFQHETSPFIGRYFSEDIRKMRRMLWRVTGLPPLHCNWPARDRLIEPISPALVRA
jgi:hypothetical protein